MDIKHLVIAVCILFTLGMAGVVLAAIFETKNCVQYNNVTNCIYSSYQEAFDNGVYMQKQGYLK